MSKEAAAQTAADAGPASTAQHRIKIKFPDAPEDLPSENLRAALVWMDFQSDEPSGSDPIEVNPSIRSDIAVELASPFAFEIPYDAPDPHVILDNFHVPEDLAPRDKKFYTMPSAEVILYVDQNQNGALDLLPLGQPGPGPDRVVALSRGRDRQGSAKRTFLVNKKNPVSNANELVNVASLEIFLTRGFGDQTRDEEAAAFAEGMYIVTLSVAARDTLAQEALLQAAPESNAFLHSRRDLSYQRFAFGDVQPALDNSITLYKVDPDSANWLARACAPWLLDLTILSATRPPPGAAIQCGWDTLLYSSSPDDYCGQVQELGKIEWEESITEPWPCGPQGLIANTPYVASTRRLDGHPLQRVTAYELTGSSNAAPPADWYCHSEVIYDFDRLPLYHVPTIAPEPGSQVRCYGHDALSYIPPRADGCQFKFSYELSSESYEAAFGSEYFTGWDMRAEPPSWWPCDENGELRAGSPYVAPRALPELSQDTCNFYGPALAEAEYPPPPNSQVHCLSDHEYRLRPLWSDICDGTTVVALWGEVLDEGEYLRKWSSSADKSWPCDGSGNFIPRPGVTEY